MAMIEVEHLSKSYGAFRAVDDVTFSVEKGEVVGFLGPNGAGKSTTLRILAGFLGASSGRVRVAGHDVASEPIAARASLGYMPETSPLYPEMRVREYLAFRAELKLVRRGKRKDAVARAIHDARLDEFADVLIGHLSKGYRQRVGLADALVASPPLLILDEPTAGLDPNQIREVRALVKRLGRDHTVLVSTHILSEVEATCTRAVVIARGKLVAEGSIDDIRALRRSAGVRVVVSATGDEDRERGLGVARATDGVANVTAEDAPGGAVALEVGFASSDAGAKVTEDLVARLVGAGARVREVAPRVASLEQVFAELTEDEGDRDARGADDDRGDDA